MKILVTGGADFIGSAVIRHISDNTSDSVVNRVRYTFSPSKNEHGRYLKELWA